MEKRLVDMPGPKGLLRWFLRAPIYLYKARLGFLFGERFLLLEHIGRKSKQARFTVVETVSHDTDRDVYYVCSGWGKKSDWYSNLTADAHATVTVGTRRFTTLAQRVEANDAARVLADYERRHPVAFRELFKRMLGRPHSGDGAVQELAEVVPMLALPVAPTA